MLNTSTAERLQDIFSTEKWKGHLAALSDTTGFNLSVHSEGGESIFSTEKHTPPCRGLRASPSFRAQCDTYCRGAVMRTMERGKPRIFKCYAKVMCFALPVEYLNEKAVILGQGSFRTYKDFREFMNLARSFEVEELPVTIPLRFTSARHAWKACCLVDGSVNQLLKNTQETVALKKKIAGLKDIVGRWGSAAREGPETLYEYMASHLIELLDAQSVTVFSRGAQRESYTHRYSLRKNGGAVETFSIGEHDSVVKELKGGRPFVSSLDPLIMATWPDVAVGTKPFYFFPIVVHGQLESIVGVFGSALKDSDIQMIATFCKQTALSIENQRLYQNLSRKFDRFVAVSELTKAITPIQNYRALLQTILDKSAELLTAEQGSLMLLDRETDALLLEAKKGIPDSITEKLRIRKGEGIAGKVAERGEPFLVENVEDDPRIQQKNRERYKTRSFVSVPLKIEDRIIGVLNLSDKATGEVFNEDDLKLIQSFATHAAIVLERNALYTQAEELKKLSITDPLTGLLNRRYLCERLEEEMSRSLRHGRHMSLLMLDLDGFKYYNDTFGHRIGDKTLKVIAEGVLKSVRSMDVVARYGGDEFMVILPETDTALAINIAERLRIDVSRTALPTRSAPESTASFITASIGIVCYPEHGKTAELLLENVDKALYLAKKKGKNRIEVFS